MASNIQRGPRRMDAGDWIRLKRLGGAKNYQTDKPHDITNPDPRLETRDGARHVYTEFGTSKTRRPASNWIDFKASQTADYVLESVGLRGEKVLSGKQLYCDRTDCETTYDIVKHQGLCVTCQYDKIVRRPIFRGGDEIGIKG
jgi:hypothetical protein